MIEANNNLILLDVRTPEEYNSGHIKGAINIPHETVIDNLHKIDSSKTILVYCGKGSRSAIAAQVLYKKGYDVYNMYEGYKTYLGEDQ